MVRIEIMTKNYKYSLDTSSRKFACPHCNKKTFVKFVDNETNQYLNAIDGRCDRESKCGYFKKPTSNCITTNTNCIIEVIQPTYHNNNVLQRFKHQQNNQFIKYLHQNFPQQNVLQVIKMYHIGSTNYWNGASVFWQIDENKVIRGGKVMLYNCNTGKRVKQLYNHISWIHKQLKLNNFVLQQCLFGVHNLPEIKKGNTICIVESEKTAIIMSIVIPNFLWLATGSNTGFKKEMLQPIKDYNIIAYPDKTEYNNWTSRANVLNKQGFTIQCSNLLENIDIENGGDLVDFLNLDS
jgi:hypothetical protein